MQTEVNIAAADVALQDFRYRCGGLKINEGRQTPVVEYFLNPLLLYFRVKSIIDSLILL